MRIAIGSDHAGFDLKQDLVRFLKEQGHEVSDLGTDSPESTDYPLYAEKVARAVVSGQVVRGVLVCQTGIGMAMAANKIPGIRAALVTDLFLARRATEHTDANVLCLAAGITAPILARLLVTEWLTATFQGGRHEHRLREIAELEKGCRVP